MVQTINAQTNSPAPSIHALHAPGIENFYQLSPGIFSGSAPEGDAAFAALKQLGIKTIITVDGAKPDVETAKHFGLRYVHLPIGYDGVPTNQAMRLIKAAETLPGPIYIHCHHGQHRGPAAAAVVCMATEAWTPTQAESWLKLAGTATNYPGLYKSVEQFRPPTAETFKKISGNFPNKSPISPLADTMVEIDGRFEHLKLFKKAGYHATTFNPDLDPAHEALLLNELFKELLRSSTITNHTADFHSKLNEAEQASSSFHRSLLASPVDQKNADAAFQRLTDGCASCHKAYRN